jgi:hypothetical protein
VTSGEAYRAARDVPVAEVDSAVARPVPAEAFQRAARRRLVRVSSRGDASFPPDCIRASRLGLEIRGRFRPRRRSDDPVGLRAGRWDSFDKPTLKPLAFVVFMPYSPGLGRCRHAEPKWGSVPHESGGRAAGIAYGGARGTAITVEIRKADAGNSSTADTHQGSVSAPGGRNELSLSDHQELGERISAILRRAEEAAEAIVHNAVEVAEQTLAEAHERASAELDAVQRDVELAHQEAAVAARAEAAAEEKVLHAHEVAARHMRQLADEIASHRRDIEQASRVLEERLSLLASEIEPAERISRPPHVTAVVSGSASPSIGEPALERIVQLVGAIVLAVTAVAAMLVLLVVLS